MQSLWWWGVVWICGSQSLPFFVVTVTSAGALFTLKISSCEAWVWFVYRYVLILINADTVKANSVISAAFIICCAQTVTVWGWWWFIPAVRCTGIRPVAWETKPLQQVCCWAELFISVRWLCFRNSHTFTLMRKCTCHLLYGKTDENIVFSKPLQID